MAQRVGNYEILEKLGQGAMGAVFKARQLSMDRVVALKVLPPTLARDQKYVQRFFREAQSAGAINHPNLVNAIECGKAGQYHFFSMEYVEGKDLRKLVGEVGPLTEGQVLTILTQMARALEAAHAKGIVHRDVKPENILYDGQTAKLADLGLAKPMTGGADVTLGGVAIGTPHYLSPEQAKGEPTDGRSDIYSLGATAFHLLAGETLFSGTTASAINVKQVMEEPRRIRQLRTDVSADLEALVLRCLAKDPDDRYQSCGELAADLERIARGEGLALQRKPASNPAVRARKRRSTASHRALDSGRSPVAATSAGPSVVAIALGILAVVVVGVVLVLAFRDSDPLPVPVPAEAVVEQESPAPSTVTPVRPVTQEPDSRQGEEMLAFACSFQSDHPESFADSIAYFQKARDAGRGSVVELEADRAIKEVAAAWDAWAQQRFTAAAASVHEDLAAGRVDAARQRVEAFDGTWLERCGDRHRELVAAIDARGVALVDEAAAAVTAAIEADDPDAADAALASLTSLPATRALAARREQISTWRQAIADHRQAITAAATAAWEEACTGLVDQLIAGEHADACRDASRLRSSHPEAAEQIRAVMATATALAARQRAMRLAMQRRIGTECTIRRDEGRSQTGRLVAITDDYLELEVDIVVNGRVAGSSRPKIRWDDVDPEQLAEWRSVWSPTDSDGQIAQALVAIGTGDFAMAHAALEAAGTEHHLHRTVARRLRAAEVGAREAEAEEAWQTLAAIDVEALDEDEIPDRLQGLEAFQASFGDTAAFTAIATDWQRLQAGIRARGRSGDWDADLLVHYGFNDDPADQVLDSSGNGFHLQADPTSKLRPGYQASIPGIRGLARCGLAVARSAADSPLNERLLRASQLTWSVWLWVEQPTTSMRVFQMSRPGNAPEPFLLVGQGRGPAIHWFMRFASPPKGRRGNRNNAFVSGNQTAPPRQWVHLAAVFNAEWKPEKRVRLYLDGMPVGSGGLETPTLHQTGAFALGDDPRRPFTGYLDELRIYERALQPRQVVELVMHESDGSRQPVARLNEVDFPVANGFWLRIWNTRNPPQGDSGTDTVTVSFRDGKREVARIAAVTVPWQQQGPDVLTLPVPKLVFNEVVVAIDGYHGRRGGLNEIELLTGAGTNIFLRKPVQVSATYNPRFAPAKLVDGLTEPIRNGQGYWLLPDGQQGTVTIALPPAWAEWWQEWAAKER